MGHVSEIGAAVIGSGFIGTVHIENLRRLGVQVRGVLDVDPQRRRAGRPARSACRRPTHRWRRCCEDPGVDVVHVTSPNQFHYPQVKQILAAGRHVVCEKPLAVTSDESRELVALAAASGRITAVNFNIRFYPLNQHAHQMVRGRRRWASRASSPATTSRTGCCSTPTGTGAWSRRRAAACGPSGDIGSHWIDLTNFIAGQKVRSVMADLTTFVKVRQRPTGEVETFSQERATDTIPVDMTTDDAALDPAALRERRPRAWSPSAR